MQERERKYLAYERDQNLISVDGESESVGEALRPGDVVQIDASVSSKNAGLNLVLKQGMRGRVGSIDEEGDALIVVPLLTGLFCRTRWLKHISKRETV